MERAVEGETTPRDQAGIPRKRKPTGQGWRGATTGAVSERSRGAAAHCHAPCARRRRSLETAPSHTPARAARALSLLPLGRGPLSFRLERLELVVRAHDVRRGQEVRVAAQQLRELAGARAQERGRVARRAARGVEHVEQEPDKRANETKRNETKRNETHTKTTTNNKRNTHEHDDVRVASSRSRQRATAPPAARGHPLLVWSPPATKTECGVAALFERGAWRRRGGARSLLAARPRGVLLADDGRRALGARRPREHADEVGGQRVEGRGRRLAVDPTLGGRRRAARHVRPSLAVVKAGIPLLTRGPGSRGLGSRCHDGTTPNSAVASLARLEVDAERVAAEPRLGPPHGVRELPAQPREYDRAVAVLRAVVLRARDDARRTVRDAHRRRDLVRVLPTRTGRAERVDLRSAPCERRARRA